MILEILTAFSKMALTFAVLCIVAGAAAFAGGIVALAVALLQTAASWGVFRTGQVAPAPQDCAKRGIRSDFC